MDKNPVSFWGFLFSGNTFTTSSETSLPWFTAGHGFHVAVPQQVRDRHSPQCGRPTLRMALQTGICLGGGSSGFLLPHSTWTRWPQVRQKWQVTASWGLSIKSRLTLIVELWERLTWNLSLLLGQTVIVLFTLRAKVHWMGERPFLSLLFLFLCQISCLIFLWVCNSRLAFCSVFSCIA